MKQILLISMLVLFASSIVQAQSIGIGTDTPDASSILEILSTDKGLLVPRMTAAERQAIVSPANALLVYDTDSACFLYYKLPTTTWINLCAEFAETDPQVGANTTNKLPKWDGSALVSGSITDSSGNVGIGTLTPSHKLSLKISGEGFSHEAEDTLIRIGTWVDSFYGAYIQTHTNHPLNFAAAQGVGHMTIMPNGNVAIGTSAPTQKLDVNGKLRVRDVTIDNTKDSVLVVSGDGTVSYRDAASLLPTATSCGFAIGDSTAGGIIFYLDASGCHGLVCATTDQSTGIQWYNGSDVDTYAYGNGIGAGEGNSWGIRRWQGGCFSCYASELCQHLILGGYNDWYLPSKYELNLMYENVGQGNALGLGNVGSFASSYYWSSTELYNDLAWGQGFGNGFGSTNGKYNALYVRAVRTF